MLFATLKVLSPAVAAWLLLVHGLTSVAAERPIGLTNVAGAARDCPAPIRDAGCATLFDGAQPLFPGGPAAQGRVTISYSGDRPSSSFGLYLGNFETRSPRSSPGCAAPDPASMLDVELVQDGDVIYAGSLAELARAHGSAGSRLQLRGPGPAGAPGRWADGDASTFTLSLRLDGDADNRYMGCVSTADFVWLASQ